MALIDATQGLDVALLLLEFVCLEFSGFLSDDQHLLVLHFVPSVHSINHSFNRVFYFSFGFFTAVLVFEVDACGQVLIKLERETHSIRSRLQIPTRHLMHTLPVRGKLFFLLDFFVFFNGASMFSVTLRLMPKLNERNLFFRFYLHLNVFDTERLEDFKEYAPVH